MRPPVGAKLTPLINPISPGVSKRLRVGVFREVQRKHVGETFRAGCERFRHSSAGRDSQADPIFLDSAGEDRLCVEPAQEKEAQAPSEFEQVAPEEMRRLLTQSTALQRKNWVFILASTGFTRRELVEFMACFASGLEPPKRSQGLSPEKKESIELRHMSYM